ncbi:hypothetical protein ACFFRR_008565 [Megaselia abdita]
MSSARIPSNLICFTFDTVLPQTILVISLTEYKRSRNISNGISLTMKVFGIFALLLAVFAVLAPAMASRSAPPPPPAPKGSNPFRGQGGGKPIIHDRGYSDPNRRYA